MSWERDGRRSCSLRLTLTILMMGLMCLAGTLLAFNAFPRLLLALLGLEQVGPLSRAPSVPASLEPTGVALDHVDVALPSPVGKRMTLASADVFSGELPVDPLMGDASTPGTTTYLLTIDEESLNRLIWELLFPQSQEKGRYRDSTIDLQPGGLVLYADVHLGIRWQRAGLLLTQDQGALTLSPAGVVVDGNLYAMPEPGSLAQLLLPDVRPARRAVEDLVIVGPLPGEARVDVARFHDDYVQILSRAAYAAPVLLDTGWQPLEVGAEWREVDVTPGTERVSMVRFNPAELRIRVHYDPANPRRISAWGTALDALLVVNGSYFAPENTSGYETVGLLVSDGQRWGTPLPDYGGMLAVNGAGDVSVRWLRHHPYDPQEPLTQAIQSFPVLVKPGGVMGFPADADDAAPSRRTVVAQDREGNILMIVAPQGRLNLHELAVYLAESDLGIDVALNLDGGGSTGMWVTTADTQVEIDSFTPVPSVIAVEKP